MLQKIREHTQGWAAGIIIAIIIFTLGLWGIHSYFEGGGSNTVVASVNGVDITKDQLAIAYERLRRQVQTQYGSNNLSSNKDDLTLKNRALQSLIEIQVLEQSSTAQGFRISDEQIDNYLQSMPEFQVEGEFSMERFQEILSSTLLSISDFLSLIKTTLLIDQPRLGIILTSFSLPDESDYTASLVNQERNLDYLFFPLSYFLARPIAITQEKIQSYYDSHQSEFMTPEQVNVEFIELSLAEMSKKINPTDASLRNFYNENVNSYTQPMEWKLASIEFPLEADATQIEINAQEAKAKEALEVLNRGEEFSLVAKKYHTNNTPILPISSSWLSLSIVPPELQKEVAMLTKPFQHSQVIKTSEGFIILKVLDIKEPKLQSFEAIKNKVRDTYIRQRAEEKFAQLREQLADLTYEHPDSLELASKTLSLPIQTSELFTKEKNGRDISQFKKVRDMAFSNDVLNAQNNSDVIQLTPDRVIVLRVKSHIMSTLLPLKSISKQIEDKLKVETATVEAEKFAETLKDKLQAGADPKQIADTYHLSWKQTGYIGRYSKKVDPAILDLGFRLPNPLINPNIEARQSYGVTRVPQGYAIVGLVSVRNGALQDEKQRSVFAEQVQNSQGLLEYELYKQSQNKSAKIKTNLVQ